MGFEGLPWLTVLILLGWGGYEVNGRLKAQRLRDKLLGSPLSDVPGIIAELKPYRRWVDPLLRQAYAEAREAGNSQKQLHAALALLPVDDTQLPYLKDRLLRADAQDISVIRQSLAGHKDAIVARMLAECWRSRHRRTRVKHSRRQVPWHSTILRILCGRRSVSTWRIGSLPRMPTWSHAGSMPFVLSPSNCDDPLIAIFHDEKRGESERTLAASALAEYLSDQPRDSGGTAHGCHREAIRRTLSQCRRTVGADRSAS